MKMNLDIIHVVLVVILVINFLLLVNLSLKNSSCSCGKNIANKLNSCSGCEGCGN